MLPLNLKSRTLIEFMGKNVITEEDLEDVSSITIYNKEKMDEAEVKLFEEDLFALLKEAPFISDLQLYGIEAENISVDRLLKESPTEKISFAWSTELFENLKGKELEVSQFTRTMLVFDEGESITEYDLFEKLKTCKAFNINPIIDIHDLDTVLKYIDISEIEVKIRNTADLEKLNTLSNNSSAKLNIDMSDIATIDGLQGDMSKSINLSINNMPELDIEKLELMETQYNLNQIYMGKEYKSSNDKDLSANAEWYDIDTYKKLRMEIDTLVQEIEGNSDIEKFLEIYKRIGNKISYDHENMDRTQDEDDTIYMGGYTPAHNLKGGLLNNTCVCEGYSKILKQALSCVDIECKYIVGEGESKHHAWNQVKIDGKWYNVDLTWDSERIQGNRALDYCLQSDEEFINHTADECRVTERSDESFDRNIINKYLGLPFDFDIETRDYSTDEIMTLISELNTTSNAGTRISINRDFETGEYSILLGNITKEGSVRWADNEIAISEENI